MAEENKHPPTTEEQTPPEMPGKAPEMEQAEIPDVGGAPRSVRKGDRPFRCAFRAGKGCSDGHPQGTEAPPVSVTEYSKREWEKPMPEPEKPKPKRGRPAKSEKATPAEPGAKKEEKAEEPRRGRPPKRKRQPRSRPSRPRLARPMRPPKKRQRPRPRKYRLRPVTLPEVKKRRSSILTFLTCTRSRIILLVSVTMRK